MKEKEEVLFTVYKNDDRIEIRTENPEFNPIALIGILELVKQEIIMNVITPSEDEVESEIPVMTSQKYEA